MCKSKRASIFQMQKIYSNTHHTKVFSSIMYTSLSSVLWKQPQVSAQYISVVSLIRLDKIKRVWKLFCHQYAHLHRTLNISVSFFNYLKHISQARSFKLALPYPVNAIGHHDVNSHNICMYKFGKGSSRREKWGWYHFKQSRVQPQVNCYQDGQSFAFSPQYCNCQYTSLVLSRLFCLTWKQLES